MEEPCHLHSGTSAICLTLALTGGPLVGKFGGLLPIGCVQVAGLEPILGQWGEGFPRVVISRRASAREALW